MNLKFNIEDWYKENTQHDTILNYKGDVSGDYINILLKSLDEKLSNISNIKTRKRIYNAFVESIQNLYHHVDNPPEFFKFNNYEVNNNFGIIILSKIDDKYKISTGNFIHKDKIKLIRDRIEQINMLSDKELRSVYIGIMGNGKFSEKGGGGLGMLDIVRKTKNQMKFNFYNYSDDYVFFELNVFIN